MNRMWLKTLVVVLVMGVNLSASAQEKAPSGPALSEREIDKRIHFIEERLDAHKKHGQIWYWSWLTINGGSMVGLGVAAGLSSKGSDRVNYASQAGLAALGVGDLLFRPLEARHGADPIRNLPAVTPDEKMAKLRAAESQLHSNAQRASERSNWVLHFANFVLNAAAGAATGLAGDSTAGAISAGAGFLMGEAYIFSEPGSPKKDWREYNAMISTRTSGGVRLWVDVSPLGLTLRGSW